MDPDLRTFVEKACREVVKHVGATVAVVRQLSHNFTGDKGCWLPDDWHITADLTFPQGKTAYHIHTNDGLSGWELQYRGLGVPRATSQHEAQ